MKSAKETTLELVKGLPDEVSMQQIVEKLELITQIERGLEDAERGNVVSNDEVMKEMREWLTSLGQ